MAKNNLHLSVSTPTRTVLEAEVDFVLLRTVEGDMGILHGHEPAAALLDYGVLHAYVDKKPVGILAVLGGFAVVDADRVTILTDLAESPDRIEETIAERKKELAESKRQEQRSDLEMQRAEAALRHALVNMDISSYSIIKGHEEKTE